MSFELTEEHLVLLWDLNQFQVPRDRWGVFWAARMLTGQRDKIIRSRDRTQSKSKGSTTCIPAARLANGSQGRGFALFPGARGRYQEEVNKRSGAEWTTLSPMHS